MIAPSGGRSAAESESRASGQPVAFAASSDGHDVGRGSSKNRAGARLDGVADGAYTGNRAREGGQWMPTDLGVTVEDRPGGLADIGEALGNAGINIEGLCGMGLGDRGVIHLLVEDGAAARAALEGAGLTVESESEAIVSEIPGDVSTPGTLGKMARAVAEAGVNMRARVPRDEQPGRRRDRRQREGAGCARDVGTTTVVWREVIGWQRI